MEKIFITIEDETIEARFVNRISKGLEYNEKRQLHDFTLIVNKGMKNQIDFHYEKQSVRDAKFEELQSKMQTANPDIQFI